MTLHAAAGTVPLVIRAKMAAGVAHAVPWGTSLDGLLASEIRENMKAVSRDAGTDYPPYRIDTVPEDLQLPLARCPGDVADGGIGQRHSPTRRTRCQARTCSTGPPAPTNRP
ncbi:hypothetical protein [Rhodococcus opacus]|uniref:hypothetical protein n=1 Tax=Rhodococcus opacus TaxID=37919 RepID=UPI0029535347|nr:hypothetical protein [Rhodococcus opacus]MDV7087305.1 hypothetical protein [Rhodococcus opacus]